MKTKDFKALQNKVLLGMKKIKTDQEEAAELNQVGVVDPNQGLGTEGLEQEEKKAEEYKGLFSWKHFPYNCGGFKF
jgi:hypothetical protein